MWPMQRQVVFRAPARDRVCFIRGSSPGRAMGPASRTAIATVCLELPPPPGRCRMDPPGMGARTTRRAPRGARTEVATLHPGHFFGEAALLREEQRSATVVAATECELLVISAGAFRAAAELDAALAERLTDKLASRLTELRKAVSDAGRDDDDERRSLMLLERIKRFFHS